MSELEPTIPLLPLRRRSVTRDRFPNITKGTKDKAYNWTSPRVAGNKFTKNGVSSGVGAGGVKAGLEALCQNLIDLCQDDERRKTFKPEEACEGVHEFVKGLPEG